LRRDLAQWQWKLQWPSNFGLLQRALQKKIRKQTPVEDVATKSELVLPLLHRVIPHAHILRLIIVVLPGVAGVRPAPALKLLGGSFAHELEMPSYSLVEARLRGSWPLSLHSLHELDDFLVQEIHRMQPATFLSDLVEEVYSSLLILVLCPISREVCDKCFLNYPKQVSIYVHIDPDALGIRSDVYTLGFDLLHAVAKSTSSPVRRGRLLAPVI